MKGLSVTTPPLKELFPIGSIYINVNTTNPGTIFGGTWEQIKDKFLLCSGDAYSNGSTGGSASVTLATENIPAHTHTRGTMNITGGIASIGHTPGVTWGLNTEGTSTNGCFSVGDGTGETQAFQDYKKTTRKNSILFNAANNWTGETSSVGSGSSFSNMPPYLSVTVWKRIA